MSAPVKSDPMAELMDAARGFMLDIYGRVPADKRYGMSPENMIAAMAGLNSRQARAQSKAEPAAAAAIRLARALRDAQSHTALVAAAKDGAS
ncbi:hypothetical protein [Paremcibacter congregatus]|uniref:hypothetical protein n=1 Tax=Paremcibacter congregatus TaxID=2043170 RepID=UPI003A950DA7